jgi:erythronate-4-phosphate dehydrogenase
MAVITIAADPQILWLESLLPANHVKIIRFDPDQPFGSITRNAEAVIVRTVTKVNPATFTEQGKTEFIGTASAGFDHIDREYLQHLGIRFAWSPGCNANAVGEYVSTAILIWCDRFGIMPSSLTLGIVGCGQTGSAVQRIMEKTGIHIHAYDPPREKLETGFTSASLDDVLGSDILSFHVPLTDSGDYPTLHWLNQKKLEGRNFALVINAARGGVVDEQALLAARSAGFVQDFIIDVWENEPDFNVTTASKAFLISPHIAGYSIQAKFNASLILCRQISEYFGFGLNDIMSPSAGSAPEIFMAESLGQILLQIHPMGQYHESMSVLMNTGEDRLGPMFARLRNAIPLRDEYPYLFLDPALLDSYPVLKSLGAGLSR